MVLRNVVMILRFHVPFYEEILQIPDFAQDPILTFGYQDIDGDAVASFEGAFAEYCGAAHAVGVGSGTDAIAIALRAAGIGAGDEVITAANTCVPTVAGIVLAGEAVSVVSGFSRKLIIT